MAKGKYHQWLTEDGLLLLGAWARDGLTDEDIAHNMGISRATLYEYKKKYPDISDALRENKEIADIRVVNSLNKKCHGYEVPVKKHFKIKNIEYENGKKVRETEHLECVYDEVHIPSDTTAIKFWLINRMKGVWQEKPTESGETEDMSETEKEVYGDG